MSWVPRKTSVTRYSPFLQVFTVSSIIINYKMESKIADINFKVVPEALEDITPFWCQTILHEGSAINKDTTVTNVEIKQITDEKSGSKDGGGLSGSTLVKLIPTYG